MTQLKVQQMSPHISRKQVPAVVDIGWKIAPLADIAVLQRGKFSPRPRTDPRYYGGQHPFIQTGDIESLDGFVRSYKQTLNDDGLSVSKWFPPLLGRWLYQSRQI